MTDTKIISLTSLKLVNAEKILSQKFYIVFFSLVNLIY